MTFLSIHDAKCQRFYDVSGMTILPYSAEWNWTHFSGVGLIRHIPVSRNEAHPLILSSPTEEEMYFERILKFTCISGQSMKLISIIK